MMARFDSANAAYGESYLLVTILACVLGGVDPAGGFGRVSGLVLALVVLQIISTACVVLGLSQFLTLAIWGGILIAVGALDAASASGALAFCGALLRTLSPRRAPPRPRARRSPGDPVSRSIGRSGGDGGFKRGARLSCSKGSIGRSTRNC